MESRFLNCMRDLYLHQLISKATRFRTSQKSNILDLILVHDKDVVAKIDYYSPIGNSDHIVLVFILRHTWNLVIKRAKQKYNFNKGEYDKMRVYIRTELSKEMCVFKQVYNVVKLNEAWRAQVKELVDETKEKEKVESGVYIYRVRGIPGKMRIVKLLAKRV
ncbi:hypothetical protein HELRODRAFT_164065 [Helobdella robusta]|uniref:Endonuclease/exonuclease/phosphatase domain-containing protein n=1 Tax=Helobdella robusta TaxID=6412 RepID=T1EUV1_HELRO|nr:hypothetical protein HELRODRAFT_164065 [Helobdella robusta]ESN94258.1 hypothetical protein HELRODRAFT_164065 [Helobdella robusta]